MAMTTGNKVLIGAGAFIALIVIVLVSIFTTFNSVRNEGIAMEDMLEGQYKTNQTELSTHYVTVAEALGVTDRGTTKSQELIVEAIKGRYDGKMEPGTGGSMFSAIAEAYPESAAATNTEAYNKVTDLVISGRTAYKNQQIKFDDQLRKYDTWRTQGYIHSTIVNMIGFPSQSLEAHVGDTVYTGDEALKQMKRLVQVKEATTAYETGVMTPLIEPEAAK